MRRASVRLAAHALAGLLMAAAAAAAVSADGVTVYVSRSIVAGPGDLSLGDLIYTSGSPTSAEREALARSLVVVSNRILFVPVTAYLPVLDGLFGDDAIIVGSRSLVIPRGLVPDAEIPLLDTVAESLQAQGLFADGITEIELTQNSARATIPAEGVPTVQIQTTVKGTTEAVFSLSGTTGKVSFVSTRNDPGTSVKQGAAVQVIFRKGQISIEMPGTALATASAGEAVSVYVAESHKSFTGHVLDGKAVKVDLP